MTLGQKLRLARTHKNLTLKEVETATGITQPYLSKLETGLKNNPSLDFIRRLASLYDIDLQWLTHEQNDATSTTQVNAVLQDIIELLGFVQESDLPKILGIVQVFAYKNSEEKSAVKKHVDKRA